MDFHAVAEAFVEGQWRVVDGTLLAPRQTLVRIATGRGRDAADIAFLHNHNGAITLNRLMVTAVAEGNLPRDSINQPGRLRLTPPRCVPAWSIRCGWVHARLS